MNVKNVCLLGACVKRETSLWSAPTRTSVGTVRNVIERMKRASSDSVMSGILSTSTSIIFNFTLNVWIAVDHAGEAFAGYAP